MAAKGQSSLGSPSATAQVAFGDNFMLPCGNNFATSQLRIATHVAHRQLRGQSSLEFLLLLAAVAALSLVALALANSQMLIQKEAHANASSLLEKSSLSLSGNLSAAASNPYAPPSGEGDGGDKTDIRLSLATGQPYYMGQPAVVQLTAWNYGGSAITIPKLLLQSNSSDLGLAPNETSSAAVGFSYTMTSAITPKKPGAYLLSGKALDSSGRAMRNSDGQPIRANATIVVLASAAFSAPDYNISAERANESQLFPLYGAAGAEVPVKKAKLASFHGAWNFDCQRACMSLSGGKPYGEETWWFQTADESGSGSVCTCVGTYTVAGVRTISNGSKPSYSLTVSVTNSQGRKVSGTLAGGAGSANLADGNFIPGNATLDGQPAASSLAPCYDSVVANASGAARLASLNKFNEYDAQWSHFKSVAGAEIGGCPFRCAITGSIDKLNTCADQLLNSTTSSSGACLISGDYVSCPLSSVQYPTVHVALDPEFLGGYVAGQARSSNGVVFEVRTS